MRKGWIVACGALLATAGGAARAAPPLEAYGRLPSIEDAQISPDGAAVAYTITDGEKRLLLIKRVADGAVTAGVRIGETKLRTVRWAGPGHILITTSTTMAPREVMGPAREYFQLVDFDVAQKRLRALMQDVPDTLNVIYGEPEVRSVQGATVAYVHGQAFNGDRGRISLFRIDLASGLSHLVEFGSPDTEGFVVDAAGRLAARAEYDERRRVWKLEARTDKGWSIVRSEPAPIDAPELLGLARDGRSVVVRVRRAERWVLEETPLTAAAVGTALPVETFDGTVADPLSGALLGVRIDELSTRRYHFFDRHDQAVWDGIAKAYPGEVVSLVSWSADHRRIVVKVEGQADGASFNLVDLATGEANLIGDVYAGIKPKDVAPVTTLAYAAADGLPLQAYLTLPRGREAKALPLVVLPHGGPESRDEPGFDWWVQALASRGYAVLQPQFRGSSGFTVALLEKGWGEWGRKMQTDLSDGVRALARQGAIDPRRVCIVGASYGGYAALAGATLDPGVYRCAASLAGPSDLRRMLADVQRDSFRGDTAGLRYLTRYFGVGGPEDARLADISPAAHADRVAAPVLLIHGLDDTVVRYDQSQAMAAALRRAGKPVEFVTLRGEDHWLSQGATRLQMLQAVVKFLEANNPPG